MLPLNQLGPAEAGTIHEIGLEIFLFFLRGRTAVVLPPVGGLRVKKGIIVMENGKMKALESLEPAKREWLLELASNARLIDCMAPLKEFGIEVSVSTLSRFLTKYRNDRLLAEGEESHAVVEALSKRGESGAFRKGTLEAVRQKLFEQALAPNSREGLRELYVELLREEAKLKELELAERKVAVAEEEARLKRALLWEAAREKRRTRVEISAGAAGGDESETDLEEKSGPIQLLEYVKEDPEKKEIADLLGRVNEILNRGGEVNEKVIEARSVLGAGMKLVSANLRSGISLARII
jgi:hypothetical protein